MRSKLEEETQKIFPDYLYEASEYVYTLQRKYVPDFISPDDKIWVECKGRFRSYDDMIRYVAIDSELKDDHIKFVFIFANPNKPAYSGIRKRKDGTYYSMKDFAEKYGIPWFTLDQLKENPGLIYE